jgi:hypothetical protein
MCGSACFSDGMLILVMGVPFRSVQNVNDVARLASPVAIHAHNAIIEDGRQACNRLQFECTGNRIVKAKRSRSGRQLARCA